MATITLSDILDDLRAADQALRKFEQRYWLSSDVFYDLYSQGLLDDGSHAEDFAEWAGHYKLKLKRERALIADCIALDEALSSGSAESG